MPIQQTSNEYFRSLYILHIALMVGLFVFIMISVFLDAGGSLGNNEQKLNDIFMILAPLLALIGLITAQFVYRNRLIQLKTLPDLKQKLTAYRGAFIVRTALIEAPGLFAVIAFLLTGNYIYIGIAGLIIAIFFVWIPSKERIATSLDLNTEERHLIENPNAIVAEIK